MFIIIIIKAQKRASTSGSQENNFRHSYANNFGAGFGKTGVRDAESLVISSSFKAVVSRLVIARKDLKSQENMVNFLIFEMHLIIFVLIEKKLYTEI